MNFDATNLATLLPHGNPMCVVDKVLRHDPEHLIAVTSAHRRQDCVLRLHDRLGRFAVIEFAAQAAALHAAAVADGGQAAPKVLGAVRNLKFTTGWTDLTSQAQTLEIHVSLLQAGATTVIYEFAIYPNMADLRGEQPLAEGKMTLIQTGPGFASAGT